MFIAAAIFILQGGDCASLFFADKQARDCCRQGQCSPKNLDPCCHLGSKTTVTQVQANEQASLLDLAAPPALSAWAAYFGLAHLDPEALHGLMFAPSPPGQLGNFSLPLLV
jgi:hypothetical protein